MLTYHITKVQKDGPAHYSWHCSCGATSSGYFTEFKARNGARLHRATISLDSLTMSR